MIFRKVSIKLLLVLVGISITVISCKDFNDLEIESNSGETDFTTVAAVGNSLTAGYQSNALFESAQRYSYPALVAGQMTGVEDFEQPLISDPGIGGRLELSGSDLSGPVATEEEGRPINTDLNRPYNNLGIPGAILADFLGQDLPGNSYADRRSNNPIFDVILRDQGDTQAEQLAALEPSFVMFWLGNNDILGYVTSGGTTAYVPPENFQELYQASAGTIAQTDADVVLYNIPDVTSIPFVFLLRSQLEQEEVISFNEETQSYQLATPEGNMDIYIETSDEVRVMRANDLILLSAQGYFQSIQEGESLPPVSPESPIPDEYILDGPVSDPPTGDSEIAQATMVVNEYNNIISDAADANGWALVDINSAFNDIVDNFQQSGGEEGITMDGITLTPIPGSIFSFDGVHPANRGHGVVANLTIDAINDTYSANLPSIDVSAIPQGLPVSN